MLNAGSQCTATGKQFHVVDLPAMMLNSHDGFLHMSVRSPGVEADDEHQIDYRVRHLHCALAGTILWDIFESG